MHTITKIAIGVGVLALAKGLDNRLEVTSYEQSFDGLPKELDGFKIAHISDLHSDAVPGLHDEICGLSPNMIAVTGDIIHDDGRSFDNVIHLFKRLSDVAPIYIITGNHDLWSPQFSDFMEKVSDCNVRLLDDTMCEIEHNNGKFALYGVRDPYGKATEVIEKNLEESFAALPDYDGFKILLFHRANQYARLQNRGFDLILSGHMHGGQFRIRGLGGLLPPKSSIADSKRLVFPKYTEGVYSDGKTTMIVNRGIGNPMIIPRIYNRPEIGIITLKSK